MTRDGGHRRSGDDRQAGPADRVPALRPRRLLWLLGGTALDAAAGAALAAPGPLLERLDPHNAIGAALFLGSVVFSVALALTYLRERRRWREREGRLAAEVAALRGAHGLAQMLIGSERQIVASWSGREGEPEIEGDPTVLGEGATLRRVLAFGAWLAPADASSIEASLARLKDRGETFKRVMRSLNGRFIDAEGRTVGGRAILRLREITGDRLLATHHAVERDAAREDLKSLRALVDALPQPLWLRGQDGQLTWANGAYLSAVEARSVEDARARALQLLDASARTAAEASRLSGEPFQARVAAVVAGQRRILDVSERPSGPGVVGMAVDISELESARSDLQREMDAHVRTLDQLPTGVAIFDARQRLAFHNASYRQLWGLDPAFLESRPSDGEVLDRLRSLRKLPEQADFRAWKTAMLAAYRGTEPQETWWHLPDRRTIRVVTSPNPQGGLTYLFDDVSERIHLEAQFNALIRVQGETLETLREGVAVFGTDGRLKLANRAFADLWRLSPDFVAAQPHVDAVVKLCRPLAPDEGPWVEIRAAVAGLSDMRRGVACRLERRDGLALDCAAQPLPDGATLVTFIDVTASVNVERALTEKNDALERASRLRDDFVHHVSYELRSPLTNIIGFSQLLGDETVGALNQRQKDYTGHITRSSAALLTIINDILDLASIDNGALELEPGTVDIRETIDAAVRGLEDRIAESNLTLVLDVPGDIGAFVADGKRVRQVLFNLLSNAIGFSSPGQTVRVHARKTGDDVVFQVTDQGRGIPPEVKARVFERFETHTLGTRHRGVGLGLSIVRSFVELHGGRVDLVSMPGAGTTVTCTFPMQGNPHRLAAE